MRHQDAIMVSIHQPIEIYGRIYIRICGAIGAVLRCGNYALFSVPPRIRREILPRRA
jgi:hypothetical protein